MKHISKAVFLLFYMWMASCADPGRAKIAMDNANAAFKEYEKLNPPRHKVQLYQEEYFRAEQAMKDKNYEEAEKYARRAERIVQDSIQEQDLFVVSLKNRLEQIKTQIELRIKSYDTLEEAYDNAGEAMKKFEYQKADGYLNEAENFIRKHQIVGSQFVALNADLSHTAKEHGMIYLYSTVVLESGNLSNVIGKVVQGTRVTFIRSYRINRTYKLFRVRTAEGIEGWVYPQFVDTSGEEL